jgi:5S rRNA maturation endonuclease (ribonuclease M5)
MRAPPEVRLERFQKLIEQISFESQRGSIIVVEGLRDKESLREMGISGTILCLQNSRMNAIRFAEQLNDTQDVVVLTDFDRQGVFLAKNLTRILNSQHVRTNLILWRDLRRLTKSDIRSIEELPKLYQRLQTDSLRIHGFPARRPRRDGGRRH